MACANLIIAPFSMSMVAGALFCPMACLIISSVKNDAGVVTKNLLIQCRESLSAALFGVKKSGKVIGHTSHAAI
jgi:hypothetical protein